MRAAHTGASASSAVAAAGLGGDGSGKCTNSLLRPGRPLNLGSTQTGVPVNMQHAPRILALVPTSTGLDDSFCER